MGLTKKALRGAGWAVAGGYASQLLAFALFVVTSRMVGPAAFGTVAVAIALVELARAVSTENVASNLVARGKFDADAFNAGFAWAASSSLLACALLALSAPWLSILFRAPDLRHVLPAISLVMLTYGASRLQEARLVQQMRFRSLALRSITATLIGGAAGIAAAHAGVGVMALVLQQWVSALLSALLLWRACDWRPTWRFSYAAFHQLSRANLALAPAGLITSLSTMIDGIAIAIFSGPAATGVYNLGKRVRLAMQLALSSALNRVSLPTFAQVRTHPDLLAEALKDTMNVSFIIIFPIFFGLAAVAPEVIDVFLGREWAQAAQPMALLLMGGAVAIATSYAENVLLVLDHRKWILMSRMVLLVVMCAGIAIFGHMGPTAIATVSLAATLVQHAVSLALTVRIAHFPLRHYATAIAAPLFISLVMLLLVAMSRDAGVAEHFSVTLRLPIQVIAGAAFYLAATWLLARGNVRAALHAARAAR